MSSLLVFNRVHRLEIQSIMVVFLTQLLTIVPLTFSLVHLPPAPPLPKVDLQNIQTESET
jgi:hypothetical protein